MEYALRSRFEAFSSIEAAKLSISLENALFAILQSQRANDDVGTVRGRRKRIGRSRRRIAEMIRRKIGACDGKARRRRDKRHRNR